MADFELTIGFPHYDDYDGLFFSLQSVRMHHPEILDITEFLIVDNNPTSAHGQAAAKLAASMPNVRYEPVTEWQGPWVKDFVFRKSRTKYAVCSDAHVMFPPGALARLVDYFRANPETCDLIQGPLVYNNLINLSTHFEPVWRGHMWGIWATDPRGVDLSAPAFEIPMQGMGLFACRREAWLGFNRMFSGFGGEEGYIHEKYRKHGHKTLCLPALRWMHRFDRPLGVPFRLVLEDRIRNYFIGFDELGLDPTQIIDHFASVLGVPRLRALRAKTLEEIRKAKEEGLYGEYPFEYPFN